MFRRIAVATVALALGVAVSAGLLAYSGSAAVARDFFAVARDLPAGAAVSTDVLLPVRAALDPPQAATLFTLADRRLLLGSRARRQLSAGQLIGRGDVEPATADATEAMVAVPIKAVPPTRAGDRVDIFALVGSGDHVSAVPFAWAVPVAAVTGDGLVLRVRSRQELAFVYAAGTMRLAAVVTAAAAPPGDVAPITSADQALAVAAG
jgi:hypothetical protein